MGPGLHILQSGSGQIDYVQKLFKYIFIIRFGQRSGQGR